MCSYISFEGETIIKIKKILMHVRGGIISGTLLNDILSIMGKHFITLDLLKSEHLVLYV